MDTLVANSLISGALVFGYVSAAVFFYRFWVRTRDRLFGLFSGAFVILAIQRLLLSVSDAATEDNTHLYVLRLVAFLLILYAIIDKNRSQTSG